MDATDWDRRYADYPWPWSREPNVFLVGEVGAMAPGRALDLACGEGRNAVWLAERGWRVTGVDFSQVAIDRARELAEERKVEVDFRRVDLLSWEPPPGAFELVVAFYLQLPTPERARVLAAAVRAVAPGGTLLVVGHDLDNLERGWGGPPTPEVLYSVADIVEEVAPLEVVKAEQVTRAVETEEGVRQAIDALVRACAPGVTQPKR